MVDLERLGAKVREEPRSLAFVAYADALRREGREAEAWDVLREGLRYHPDLSSARVVAARLHVWEGRPQLAADILADVLSVDPANDSARLLLVRLLVEQGRLGEARAHANVLAMSGSGDSLGALPRLPPPGPIPAAPDPFDSPRAADWFLERSDFARAAATWRRIVESTGSPDAVERLDEIRWAAGGHFVARIEALPTRSAASLPGRREAELALAEEAAERPAAAHRIALSSAFWAHVEAGA